MSKTGQELAAFAQSKLGTPYVYGAKGANGPLTQQQVDSLSLAYPNVFTAAYRAKIAQNALVGKVCCDCSGLVSWYTEKVLGSAQLYSQAYTRLPIANIKDFAVGTVLWKEGHVGIYMGLINGVPYDVQEKGIDYGCITQPCSKTGWKYGLTFSWMTYSYAVNLSNQASWKGTNPYAEPSEVVKYILAEMNTVKESVKWLQWELNEAGYNLNIDGKLGPKTLAALKAYQASCKIEVDGKCGPETRTHLRAA